MKVYIVIGYDKDGFLEYLAAFKDEKFAQAICRKLKCKKRAVKEVNMGKGVWGAQIGLAGIV